MSEFGLILISLSLVVAIAALWLVWRLRLDLLALKQEQSKLERGVQACSLNIESAVDPLRIQTAGIAQGKSVSAQLIRAGRLYHSISAQEAEHMLSLDTGTDRILLLDVRTNAEFSKEHIPGAHVIPVEDLEKRYSTEVPLTLEKIIVYCADGDRSQLACDFLSRHDFGNVYHVRDGLQGWSGPMEGNQIGGLIQIASKAKPASRLHVNMLASIHSF